MKKRMFNDRYCLTAAVLQREKTMTRSLIKPQPSLKAEYAGVHWVAEVCGKNIKKKTLRADFSDNTTAISQFDFCEKVAVAQRYSDIFAPDKVLYRSVGDGYREGRADAQKGWDNKMFVAPNLMPHYIGIDKVRCERLQDISEEDCMKEGIKQVDSASIIFADMFYFYCDYGQSVAGYYNTAREAFADLIDKVMGKGTWESNPWVWVYEFTLIQ